jgi:NAD(P)H dehydrogenase (quinone)
MNVLIVYAHYDEQGSFNASMKDTAVEALSREGHTVEVSDLYAMHFEPRATVSDFTKLTDVRPINYLMEQKHAAETRSFSLEIKGQMEKVRKADLIIFQFPLWWSSVPAILKGWFDRVLALGFAWDFGKTYDLGLLKGKKALLAVTTGGTGSSYGPDGISGDIRDVLFPINHGTLYFCGMEVFEPFVAFAVFQVSNDTRKRYLEEYRQVLENIGERQVIQYHPHADYDEHQRMKKEVVPAG